VAPLDRLVRWCLPLLVPGGQLLALKGARAGEEVTVHRSAIARAGGVVLGIEDCGAGQIDPPARVVIVQKKPAK
jgi:16S rRNA (guanine527-N7)-methyltransferase